MSIDTDSDARLAQLKREIREAESTLEILLTQIAQARSEERLGALYWMWDRLTHELELAKRNSMPLAVLFLDLNDFKKTNDRLGHDVGDQLLRHVAGVLKATLRASDTVCRIGGDEFVIIAENVPSEGIERLIAKVVAAVARPWAVAGAVLTQGVSIGASSFPADGDQAEELVRKADAGMYLVKLAARAANLTAGSPMND